MTTLYHNPRCSKSRQVLALLEEKGVEAQIRLYLEKPPTARELKTLLSQLGIGARALLRTGEKIYKELNLKDDDLSEAALIKAMVNHPILIERPIVIKGDRAVIGRPPEKVMGLL